MICELLLAAALGVVLDGRKNLQKTIVLPTAKHTTRMNKKGLCHRAFVLMGVLFQAANVSQTHV